MCVRSFKEVYVINFELLIYNKIRVRLLVMKYHHKILSKITYKTYFQSIIYMLIIILRYVAKYECSLSKLSINLAAAASLQKLVFRCLHLFQIPNKFQVELIHVLEARVNIIKILCQTEYTRRNVHQSSIIHLQCLLKQYHIRH